LTTGFDIEYASSPKADVEVSVIEGRGSIFESPHRKKSNGSNEYIADESQIAKIVRLREINKFKGSGRSQYWTIRLQVALNERSYTPI
jgi:hypothetical protein